MKPGEHKPNMEPKEAGILRCKIEEGVCTVYYTKYKTLHVSYSYTRRGLSTDQIANKCT